MQPAEITNIFFNFPNKLLQFPTLFRALGWGHARRHVKQSLWISTVEMNRLFQGIDGLQLLRFLVSTQVNCVQIMVSIDASVEHCIFFFKYLWHPACCLSQCYLSRELKQCVSLFQYFAPIVHLTALLTSDYQTLNVSTATTLVCTSTFIVICGPIVSPALLWIRHF